MSQHQQAFLADNASDIARVARRVLSMLATGDAEQLKSAAVRASLPTPPGFAELMEQVYGASFYPDPIPFAAALRDVQAAGYSDDVVAFELIPAIARQLGASWVDDLISFADVTIGCARLQSALHLLPDNPAAEATAHNGLHQDCLVLVPLGAQHTLGALVLAKQLRHVGQRVVVELEAEDGVLEKLAQTHRFDVVLVSASCGECPDALRALVGTCRQQWGACKIVLGGSIGDLDPDLVNAIGADNVTSEWQQALDLCI